MHNPVQQVANALLRLQVTQSIFIVGIHCFFSCCFAFWIGNFGSIVANVEGLNKVG